MAVCAGMSTIAGAHVPGVRIRSASTRAAAGDAAGRRRRSASAIAALHGVEAPPGRSAGRPACRHRADRRRRALRRPCSSRRVSSSFTERCTISRRSEVQRWPAVPTAPKTMARSARSRSAAGVTIIALLPPSSRIERPKRAATARTDGAAHRRRTGGRDQRDRRARRPAPRPSGVPPMTICASPAGAASPKRAIARSSARKVASPDSGAFCDGLKITGSPQTSAIAAFQANTATREVEGGDHRHRPERMPLLHQPVARPLGDDGAAVQLARQAERELAHVDAFLHLAAPFAAILPTSSPTTRPMSSLAARSSSPHSRTSWPRTGAGTSRQRRNASLRAVERPAARRAASRAAAASPAPSIGERAASVPPAARRRAGRSVRAVPGVRRRSSLQPLLFDGVRRRRRHVQRSARRRGRTGGPRTTPAPSATPATRPTIVDPSAGNGEACATAKAFLPRARAAAGAMRCDAAMSDRRSVPARPYPACAVRSRRPSMDSPPDPTTNLGSMVEPPDRRPRRARPPGARRHAHGAARVVRARGAARPAPGTTGRCRSPRSRPSRSPTSSR